MADTTSKFYDIHEYEPAPGNKSVHHGRTLASWVGSTIALVAFIVGAIGLVMWNWTVFWAGAVLIVIAVIATVVLQKMGKGAV